MSSLGFLIITLTIGTVFLNPLKNDDITAGYRLPSAIWPESYTIELTPYLLENEIPNKERFTFDGKALITIQAKNDVQDIILHVKSLKMIKDPIVSSVEGLNLVIDKFHNNETTDKYLIKLKEPLVKDEKYILTFEYSGALSNDMLGFYRSSYNENGIEKWLAATQFEFTHARKVFPCFDEPRFKATFEVTINSHNDFKVFSNTDPIETNLNGDRTIVKFEKTPVMPIYTLAFLVSNFTERQTEHKNFSVVAQPDAYSQTEFSLKIGPEILEKLNSYTNLIYNKLGIKKIHMAAIPDFSYGAMENWGLITFKERALLYHANHTTDLFQQSIATIIAHELAHMWFGNLVTCDWWSYAWLNEGFATYFEYFITHEINKEWEMDKQFIVALQLVLNLDSLENSHALTMNENLVETYSEISNMFDKITYTKGAAIIRMFQDLIGDNNFKNALQKYLEDKKFTTSKPSDLFNFLSDAWNTDEITNKIGFFEDWTKQVGYPLVTMRIAEDGRLFVNQSRFLLSPKDDEEKILYTIPLSYSLENDFTTTNLHFLSKTSENQKIQIPKEVKWVIGNINQKGYYRVNYDEKTWYNIYNALMSDNWSNISEINRAQIVDDLMNLGRSGHLSYGLVLNILDYLKTEINFLPWTSAFNGFSFIVNKMTASQREIFSKYILKLSDKVYNRLGFIQKSDEKRLDTYAREKVLLWACKYGHQECITKSEQYFAKMQQNIEVPLNIRAPVFCTAIREGSDSNYKYLVEKYENSTETTEKFLILTALSCTRNKDIIKIHYDYILSDKVRKQDKKAILISLYTENPLEVFHLINTDYKKINESFGGGDAAVANILSGIAKLFTTNTEKQLYEKFIQENKNNMISSAIKVLENGIKSIDLNINFSRKYLPSYLDHLKFKLAKDGYRLSTVVLPLDYTIKLTPYLLDGEGPIGHDKFTFDGEASITLKATQSDINEIVLHTKNLKIITTTLNLANAANTKIDITDSKLNHTTDKLVLTLNGSLMKNEVYNLNFIYTGIMGDDMHGFYKSSYKDKEGNERWLASTQFQTVHARKAFPCFDEPKFKAIFNVIINRHHTFKAISNMKIKETSSSGERAIDTFQPTPIMSTYILAFLVSDFKERHTSDENFLVIARSDAYNQTEYSFEVGPQILEKLNKYTGLEYKSLGNPKMHLAAIPDFSAGAMENWGLLTFRERGLLYDANETTDAAQQSIALVIAHEQAHMWFGDYVTCDWWGYTWLNEGFARYFQYLMTHEVCPSWELDKQFVVDQIHTVMKMDSLNDTHPMSDPTIESPAQVTKMFGSISYNKGASILRMFNTVMNVKGDTDNFRSAIQKYLKAQEYKNSLPEDLFNYLGAEWDTTEINKTEFFYDWTTQVGYPLVTLNLSKDKKTINVTQKRFLLKSDAGDPTLLYTIPLTFTTSKEKNFNNTKIFYVKKSPKSMTIPLNDTVDWVIANIRQTGYYRVNYDESTWHGIHHALFGKDWSGIHEINRAQIVDDLMNLGQSGHLKYVLVLNILEYLETELNYLPWTAAFNGFSTIAARIGSDDKEFRSYILTLLNNVYNQLGFEEKKKDTRLDKYNRPKVLSWACKYGHKNCTEMAKKYFDNLKENKTVPVNIRSAVYCSVIRNGKTEDYDYLIKKYENSTVATEQVLILAALGCAKNNDMVKNYYNYILSDKVRRQDRSSSLSSLISQNPENSNIIFNLIVNDFKSLGEALADEDKDVAAANIMKSVANYFTNQTQIDELNKFHNDNAGRIDKKALQIIEKAGKTSKQNIEWSEKYLSEYKKYLKEYLKKKAGSASNKSLSIVLLSLTFILSYLYY